MVPKGTPKIPASTAAPTLSGPFRVRDCSHYSKRAITSKMEDAFGLGTHRLDCTPSTVRSAHTQSSPSDDSLGHTPSNASKGAKTVPRFVVRRTLQYRHGWCRTESQISDVSAEQILRVLVVVRLPSAALRQHANAVGSPRPYGSNRLWRPFLAIPYISIYQFPRNTYPCYMLCEDRTQSSRTSFTLHLLLYPPVSQEIRTSLIQTWPTK